MRSLIRYIKELYHADIIRNIGSIPSFLDELYHPYIVRNIRNILSFFPFLKLVFYDHFGQRNRSDTVGVICKILDHEMWECRDTFY